MWICDTGRVESGFYSRLNSNLASTEHSSVPDAHAPYPSVSMDGPVVSFAIRARCNMTVCKLVMYACASVCLSACIRKAGYHQFSAKF